MGPDAQRRHDRGPRRHPQHVPAPRDEVRQARVDHPPVAGQVDVELRGEDIGIEVAQRPGGGDARVGDADVDAAACLHDVLDRRGDRFGLRHVTARPHRIAEARCRLLDGGRVQVEQGDAVFGRQAPGALHPDAARGTGDECDRSRHVPGAYEPGRRCCRA